MKVLGRLPKAPGTHWRCRWGARYNHTRRPALEPTVSAAPATSTSTASALRQPVTPRSPDGGAVPPVPSSKALDSLPFYSQYPLDRHAEWRRDELRLDELFARPDAKLLPLLRDRVLTRPAASSSSSSAAEGSAEGPATPAPPLPSHPAAPGGSSLLHPVLLCPASAHAELAAAGPARVFLGTDADGAPYFAAAVPSAAAAEQLAAANPGSSWASARAAGPDMSPGDAALCAVASGMMVWHSSNGFSAATGAPMVAASGGFARRPADAAGGGRGGGGSTYPRIDPAVIMLVRSADGGYALLGRKAEWPTDRYSTLAGFLDAGEPLEAAVAREVAEEAGVGVDLASVSYPAAAPATGFDLLPLSGRNAALDVGLFKEEVQEVMGPLQALQWPAADEDELADVRWFHRDWLRAVFASPAGAATVPGAGRFNIPGPYSLAYRLITSWVGARPGAAAAAAGAADSWVGDSIPQVLISGSGTFKYVLMRLWDPSAENGGGRSKLLVWGDTRAPYHNDVLQKAKAMARPLGLQVTPLGGGRMRHEPEAGPGGVRLEVYGYSAAFGPAPHELVAALVHRWYPLYDRQSITVSYEGY
ncbi:hypothetical protein GPECTOR_36g61 [Gonium pectorale]|uniref:NAD(+) diphosphatase n=1 Tax=Gonium pectorale TaxID=33097 RepID=A0A150GBV3_GONPE|nr:hypothetical protein GPECTOR_36g61 [Gonium pectorale]|eukprot:KXZ47337.1 hypothetical protein GPECTOR_36g61 [Gonium pectorale]